MSKYCTNCGNLIPDGSNFCVECGTKLLEEKTVQDSETPNFCTNCGATIDKKASFCVCDITCDDNNLVTLQPADSVGTVPIGFHDFAVATMSYRTR